MQAEVPSNAIGHRAVRREVRHVSARLKPLVGQLMFHFLVTAVVAWCILPFVWIILSSVKVPRELTALPPILPTRLTWENYARVFEDRPFERYIINSVIVAGSTTLFNLALGSLAAYALARLRIRGKLIILGLVLAISMFPEISIVSSLYVMLRNLKLLNTYSALVFPYSTFAMPLTIWVLTSFFRQIPKDLEEAALVDGCTPVQAMARIIMPLAAPGLFTTAILVFINAWNEFLFALTFTSTIERQTVPVGIAFLPVLFHVPWGSISAASVVVTIPLVVLVLIFQRRIISGLTAGAVKG
ncbi:MAG: carbohydrate ABC transporter permease [Limnochordaceae bacterium]|nr:carbohydrate ABC transporter permease [Limnochordaceae bacterium]